MELVAEGLKSNKHVNELNLGTMKATTIAPFSFDLNKQNGPCPVSGFSPAFDAKSSTMYIGCNPDQSNFWLEGICSVEVKKSSKNLPIMVSPWKNRPTNFTMTSIDFSAASGEVIFMAQQVSEDMSKLSATKLFSWSPKTKDFAELIDLGLSWGTLHQTTISSDGRYLSAKVQVGSREAPIDHMLLVDVVQKKIVRRVVPKDDQNIALLSMMAC